MFTRAGMGGEGPGCRDGGERLRGMQKGVPLMKPRVVVYNLG